MVYRDANGYVWQESNHYRPRIRREDLDDAIHVYLDCGTDYKLSRNGRFCDKIDGVVKFKPICYSVLYLDISGKLFTMNPINDVELASNVEDFYVFDCLVLIINRDRTSYVCEYSNYKITKIYEDLEIPEGEILSFAEIDNRVNIETKKFEQQIEIYIPSNIHFGKWFEAHIDNGELFIDGKKYTCDSPAQYIRERPDGILIFCEDRSLYFALFDGKATHERLKKIDDGQCFPIDYIPPITKSARSFAD